MLRWNSCLVGLIIGKVCVGAALTTCPHITHFLNVSDSNTDMDRWGSDPEYAKHVIDEQQAWEQIHVK